MTEVRVVSIDSVYNRIIAEPHIMVEMSEYFTFDVPGAKFMPAYKNKMWDGKIRLLNIMTGLLYAGLFEYVKKFCDERGYTFSPEKALSYTRDVSVDIANKLANHYEAPYEPRDYQALTINHALKYGRSLFLSPTASGKSFMIYLISRYFADKENLRTLIIVPTITLVSQMSSDFVEYNNGKKLDIHRITSGVDKNTKAQYVVTTWQSIMNMPKTWFDQFGVVIGDEAHLFKAKSLTKIMEKTGNISYKYGFTGTLDDSQTHKLVLEGLFGKVVKVTETSTLIANQTLSAFDINAIVLGYSKETRKTIKGKTYQEEIDVICASEKRNQYITKLAQSLNGNTLILFQYVEKHGMILKKLLDEGSKPVHFVHGSISGDDRENIRKTVENGTNNIVLASYGTFSTGVNIVNLDYIIFASPSKSKIRNLQSIGRVLRRGGRKTKATLFDIVDDMKSGNKENFALLHFKERARIYVEEGFDFKIYNVTLEK